MRHITATADAGHYRNAQLLLPSISRLSVKKVDKLIHLWRNFSFLNNKVLAEFVLNHYKGDELYFWFTLGFDQGHLCLTGDVSGLSETITTTLNAFPYMIDFSLP